MPLKTPQFWYAPAGLIALLLTPLSWLYRLGGLIYEFIRRQGTTPFQANIPVICIGNAVAGGSGKTPTAIALCKLVKEQGIAQKPWFISRGYGRDLKTACIVDLEKHGTADVGDEALLLAKHAPVIVGVDRAASAKIAIEHDADLLIMDDGLQNNSLQKDVSLLVIDGHAKFGNNKIIPAGPLRESIKKIMQRIDAIIYIGGPLHSDKPIFQANLSPTTHIDTNTNYIAFAGLGRPEKFKHTLEQLDINLSGWHEFPDHHPYKAEEIESLIKEAEVKNATLITTEKDHVRIPANLSENIMTLPVEINFHESETLANFLKDNLKR